MLEKTDLVKTLVEKLKANDYKMQKFLLFEGMICSMNV